MENYLYLENLTQKLQSIIVAIAYEIDLFVVKVEPDKNGRFETLTVTVRTNERNGVGVYETHTFRFSFSKVNGFTMKRNELDELYRLYINDKFYKFAMGVLSDSRINEVEKEYVDYLNKNNL